MQCLLIECRLTREKRIALDTKILLTELELFQDTRIDLPAVRAFF